LTDLQRKNICNCSFNHHWSRLLIGCVNQTDIRSTTTCKEKIVQERETFNTYNSKSHILGLDLPSIVWSINILEDIISFISGPEDVLCLITKKRKNIMFVLCDYLWGVYIVYVLDNDLFIVIGIDSDEDIAIVEDRKIVLKKKPILSM
jgi:hypothetical protein